MRKLICLSVLFLFLLSANFAQQVDKALARVNVVSSRLVFFRNNPTTEYETAFTFYNKIENVSCLTPEQISEASIKNANAEAVLQNRMYDAIMITNNDRDIAITWKDKSKDNAICRVKKTEGIYYFLYCEPLAEYDIAGKYNVSMAITSALLGVCPGENEKINKLLRKASKDKLIFDAIIYGNSANDMVIKFK